MTLAESVVEGQVEVIVSGDPNFIEFNCDD
jgi:hypothetical protein